MPSPTMRRPPTTVRGTNAHKEWVASASTTPQMPQPWMRIPQLIADRQWFRREPADGHWNRGPHNGEPSLFVRLLVPPLADQHDESDRKSWKYAIFNHHTPGCHSCNYVEALHWPEEQIAMIDYLFRLLCITADDISDWIQNEKTVSVYGYGAGTPYSNVALWVTTVNVDNEEVTEENSKSAVIECDLFYHSVTAETFAIFMICQVSTELLRLGVFIRAPRNDLESQVTAYREERSDDRTAHPSVVAYLYEALRDCQSTPMLRVIDQAFPVHERRENPAYTVVDAIGKGPHPQKGISLHVPIYRWTCCPRCLRRAEQHDERRMARPSMLHNRFAGAGATLTATLPPTPHVHCMIRALHAASVHRQARQEGIDHVCTASALANFAATFNIDWDEPGARFEGQFALPRTAWQRMAILKQLRHSRAYRWSWPDCVAVAAVAEHTRKTR